MPLPMSSAVQIKRIKVVKDVIRPALLQIRDTLLAQNYPAAIVPGDQDDCEESERPYIALHASNDIKHATVVARDPMFRTTFRWFIGCVEFSATRMQVKAFHRMTLPEATFATLLTKPSTIFFSMEFGRCSQS